MSEPSTKLARRLCLVTMALALVLFLGTVGSGFVWDDELLFRSWLPYFDGPSTVLSPPPGIPHFMYQYYRPALVASYLIDERLASALFSPEARDQGRRIFFHLTPVLLHVACTGLVFLLGALLLRRRREAEGSAAWIAFAGALLFAVHPIHVESVAWIVGRSDSLCTLAALASLIALLRWREGGRARWLVAAASFFLLALFTKEIAAGLLLPALVIAVSWPADGTRRRRVPEVAAFGAAVLVYGGLRIASSPPAHATFAASGALPRALGAFGWYAVKFLWPFPQSAFPDERIGIAFTIAGLVAAVLSVAALVFWRGGSWAPERIALALAIGGIAASVAVAVTNVSTSPVAERNLYLPSAGACLLVAMLADRLARRSGIQGSTKIPAVVVLAGVLAIPASWAVSRRVAVWDNPVAFWNDAVTSAPESAVARINLGAALVAVGRLPEGEESYEVALRLAKAPDQSSMAHANLGSVLMAQGRFDAAITHFTRALVEDPRDATSQFNWASALAEKAARSAPDERAALLTDASAHLEQALTLHPRYSKAHLLLGTILLGANETERARSELTMAAELDPQSSVGARARELLAELRARTPR